MRGMGVAIAAAMLAVPGAAQAEWMQATTKHFVIYADESPAAIARRATRLEVVDAFLRAMTGLGGQAADDANKLTIYVVDTIGDLQRLYGKGGGNVGGFYSARVSGPVAFTPRSNGTGEADLTAQIVLFHEYAHHFLLGNYAAAYPGWFSEGYAEVVSTMQIDDKKVSFGNAANHRGYSLFAGGGLTLTALFDPPARRMTEEEIGSLYAKGWLLTHYLMMNRERRATLNSYFAAINSGTPSLPAAKAAFGDLRKLDNELDRYLRASHLPGYIVDRDRFPVPAPDVRPLSAGQAAMIDQRMVSVRGINAKTAPGVFAKGARIAAAYPTDAVVQGWLAEMAYDANDLAAADAAADRALAADPASSQALLYKARVGLAKAVAAKAPPAAFRDARAYILRANKASNDNAQALHLYYQSFHIAGQEPTANAKEALYRAQELVPQDGELRMEAVAQLIADDELGNARRRLLPLAYSPHAPADALPRRLLAALDAKQQRPALLALLAAGGETGDDGD